MNFCHFFSFFKTFCHLNLHFCNFFTLCCNFFDLNLHFYVFFTLACDFLWPKFTFFDFFHYAKTFCHLDLHFLIKFYLNVSGLVKCNPIRAASYLPLLKELKAKRGCLNIQNNDEKYFLWSILALLHPVQYRNSQHRVPKYQEHERDLYMSGIQYPIDINDINKLNTKTILVLMFMGKKIKKTFSLSITTITAARHHVNLLYITAGETSH